jgi:hypothetical protein
MAKVFILGGQSNMIGGAKVADLPDSLRSAPPHVRLYEDGAFRDLVHQDTFGPEVGLAHALAEADTAERLVLCKVARGGANLYYDWNPERDTGGPEDEYRGPMYPRLLASLEGLESALRNEGHAPTPAAMLWMQGERDSVFERMSAGYASNLTSFIARVRSDTGVADLPFLVGEIAPRSVIAETGRLRHPWRDAVRQAQADVAAADPRVAFIRTNDLGQFDDLHFDAAGQLELGRRFAGAYLAMVPDADARAGRGAAGKR